jgi:hypothetical protein
MAYFKLPFAAFLTENEMCNAEARFHAMKDFQGQLQERRLWQLDEIEPEKAWDIGILGIPSQPCSRDQVCKNPSNFVLEIARNLSLSIST